MQKVRNTISWVAILFLYSALYQNEGRSAPVLSFQDDGSLVVSDAQGLISDFVKQGTPRQSIQISNQSCNVSYGYNSSGKKTVLLSVPANAGNPVVFLIGENQVTVPQKSTLRISLRSENEIAKMDGNPADTVLIKPRPSAPSQTSALPPPMQSSPAPAAAILPSPQEVTRPSQLSSLDSEISKSNSSDSVPSPLSKGEDLSSSSGWPGKLLSAPIPESQMEEDQFYVRTDFGPRFVSSMNLVSVSGPDPALAAYNQKEIAFSTGYRQDIDLGVWLTDWFGLAVETGFALNAVRGNTQGMTVSSSTFWTVPLLAQLCFQYPNDSGWYPYINFGFGGGWTVFKVGGINYLPGVPQLSGTGSSVNNAYQIAVGVRYRLYEQLSVSMAYKFYGNSQANINLDNGVQATLGSPVTQSAEVGLNFSF